MAFPQMVLVLLAFFCASPAHAAQGTDAAVKVVVNHDYPPFSFYDSSGSLQGIVVDMWRLWERKTGLKAELHAMDWAEAQRRTEAGEFQVIDSIFYSETRAKKYEFSPPYYKVEVPAFFNGEVSGLNSPKSLKGFVVAVMAGDSVIEVLKQHQVTHLAAYPTYHSIIEAARQGKVVVFAADKPPALYYLYQSGLFRKFKQTRPLAVGELHRAYPKGEAPLMAKVEQGFSRISAGEMGEIQRKWLGSAPLEEKTPRYLAPVAGGVALALLLLAAWNLALRKRVAQRTAELRKEIETSNQRAEELQLSERSFRAVYDSVSEGIVIYDLESGGILDINQTMCEMFGFGRGAPCSIAPAALSCGVPPYTSQEMENRLREAGEGVPQRFEWQSRDRNGQPLWTDIHISKGQVREREVLLITLRDISDRKLGEEALSRSEQKFREIVESAPVGIFQSTTQGRFFSVNPALATMFHFVSTEEMVGSVTDIAEQLFVHPEQRRVLVKRVLTRDGFVQEEVDYRRKDGGIFTANLYQRAVRNKEGVVQYLEGFVEDVTERKRVLELTRTLNTELEERVRERTAELERTNEALQQEVESRRRDQQEISCLNQGLMLQRTALEAAYRELEAFSYSVSHDLRAPLRHIHAFSELLIQEYGSEFRQEAVIYLETISKSAVKMQELIDGLLSLSRVSRGELKTAPVDLSVYAREIAQELVRSDPRRKVSFEIAESAPASADQVLIRSVLENLLGNAWKYSAKKESATIEFGYLHQDEGEPVYYVRDDGAGFDMAYADKLFGVFQRMHSSEHFEGCGVGLATVQRIVIRHGGRIWAEAEVNKGATFYFTLSQAPPPCWDSSGSADQEVTLTDA
ncbi:PAS domain S-box protein [Geomonas sp.]|uniref:PAS domain S-box protein n=1 Tax=Geomonas sp. TaxID=2651584 RepID=UPI002B4A45D4|nr:transporter substrate-binding domain-containing protein [Geomonas sp.]HJV35135.1 transporter substrate-binding domain-containing protein [Geomonas sp.]